MASKKIIALAAAAALATCVALVGCGGSQSSAASSAASSSAASSAAASSAASSAAVESSSAAASDTAASAPAASATAASASAPAASATSTPAASAAASGSAAYIGEEAAQEIALKDAGVSAADCTELSTHLDTDDGFVHYDVDFKAGGKEYDYDINPTTGAITKAESEIDD